MRELTVYECEYCKKLFRTKNRHDCKKDPAKKNCFTCKFLKDWLVSDDGTDVGIGFIRDPNYPDCVAGYGEGWDIEAIKSVNYNMQCSGWQQGEYVNDVLLEEVGHEWD
jgi:hypothetical protein